MFRSSQEEFLRCDGEQGSALRGGFLSARAERNQRTAKGWAQDGHSRAHIRPPPGPPFFGGRQLGRMVRYRKGAGGQRIGFRSTTAAAEFPVTFGWYSYWLEARLCCGGAQVRLRGTAGGASPSPTHNKKVVQVWVGEALGPSAVNRPSTVGSAKPGAVLEPQQF